MALLRVMEAVAPSNWAFDQIQEYPLGAADGSFGIDKNTVSGSYRGFSQTEGPLLRTTTKQVNAKMWTGGESGSSLGDGYNGIALKGYGVTGGGAMSKYVLATTSLVNETLLGKPTTYPLIEEVRIKIMARDGVRFDTSQMEGSTGCYPPVDFKSKVELFAQKSIATLLLQAAIRIFEIKDIVLITGAKEIVKLVAKFDGAKTEEVNTSELLSRTFRWNEFQAQTNQAMTFYPISPSHGGSFDIEYTMVSGKSSATGPAEITNILHVENPYSS